MRRVFVSYCSRNSSDKEIVKDLIRSINAQKFSVWNYESEQGEIPTGVDIIDYCRKQIDLADIIICVVTLSAFKSYYTKVEVQHILKLVSEKPTFTVVIGGEQEVVKSKNWPPPYSCLRNSKHRRFGGDYQSQVDHFVEKDICRVANTNYVRRNDQPRLRLEERVLREIKKWKGINSEFEVGNYDTCSRKARKVEEFYLKGDKKRALDRLRALITEIEDVYQPEFGDSALYYPKLLEQTMLCEIITEDRRPRENLDQFKSSLEALESIVIDFRDCVDENIYSAIGNLSMAVGDSEKSLRAHYDAHQAYLMGVKCGNGRNPKTEADLIHNQLLAEVISDSTIHDEELATRLSVIIQENKDITHDYEVLHFRVLQVFVQLRLGRIEQGWSEFQTLINSCEVAADHVVEFFDLLIQESYNSEACIDFERAVEILKSVFLNDTAQQTVTPEQLFFAAKACFQFRDAETSLRFFEALRRYSCISPEYCVIEALVRKSLGDNESAHRLCLEAAEIRTNQNTFPFLSLSRFNYFRGLAKYLLGQDHYRELYLDSGMEAEYEIVVSSFLHDSWRK